MAEISRRPAGWLSSAIVTGVSAYAAYVAFTWLRYGHPSKPAWHAVDPLLDRFMPEYDVVERHVTYVRAPAAITLETAKTMDLGSMPVVRGIFKAREIILGATPDTRARPRGLLEQMLSFGWVLLAETPGREVVVGAVTKPWEADVVFRSIPPDGFAAFEEPGYVKIAWTLRADYLAPNQSLFRTETRAIATGHTARVKFRRYWSFLSPGIILIRRLMLAPLRAAAEREASVVRHLAGA